MLWAIWQGAGVAEGWRRQALAGGSSGERADRDLDAVLALFDAAGAFVDRLPTAGPDSFLEHVQGQDVPGDTLLVGGQSGGRVALLTPQTAAGREWRIVVVAGVQEGVWPDLRLRGSVLGSEDLVDVVAQRPSGFRAAQAAVRYDETRLFLVAVTRATERLLVTAVGNEDEQPSVYLDLVDPPATTRLADEVRPHSEVARTMTLPGLVGELRREAVSVDPGVAEPALGLLAAAAREGVRGADPSSWWALRPVTSDRPVRRPDEPVPVSPSKVTYFAECGLRWFLTSVGGEGVSLGAASVGTFVHDIVAELPDAPLEELRHEVDARWGRLGLRPGWVTERTRSEAHDMVARFAAYRDGAERDWQRVGIEEPLPRHRREGGRRRAGRPHRARRRGPPADHRPQDGQDEADAGRAGAARAARRLPGRRRGGRFRRAGRPQRGRCAGLHRQGRSQRAAAERAGPAVARRQRRPDVGAHARRGDGRGHGRRRLPRRAGQELRDVPGAVVVPRAARGRRPVSALAPESVSRPRHSARDIAAALEMPPPTDEQAAVIEAGAAPLLVVAGAGSGKTETMAARVVWLVANGHVDPDQVLGLTFTRKAAAELAQRIATRLRGLERAGLWTPPADDGTGAEVLGGTPTVSTYHAYAGRLVREHALRVGIEPEFRVLTEAGAWQLAAEAVSRWDGPMEGVVKSESTVIAAVMALAGEMAEHVRTPGEVIDHLDAVLARLDALPDGDGKGSLTTARDTVGVLRERRTILPIVQAFLDLKRERESLDFADQMAIAARLTRSVPAVGLIERERFRAVLLDEFQDTSEAQLDAPALALPPPGRRADRCR